MNKTEKFLRRLSLKERLAVGEIIEKIEKDDTGALDMKKLKGQSGLFRVRHGSVRVVFQKTESATVVITTSEGQNTIRSFVFSPSEVVL